MLDADEDESDAKFDAWETVMDRSREELAAILGFPVEEDSPLEEIVSRAFDAGYAAAKAIGASANPPR